MVCRYCSAPLSLDSTVCRYCGSYNDIDFLNPASKREVASTEQKTCPDCTITLTTISPLPDDSIHIDQCAQCFGLFFDIGELDAFINSVNTSTSEVNYSRLAALINDYAINDKVVYRKCPVCGEIMNRKNYGKLSGVIIDTCKPHGIWLDSGELKKIIEWHRAGGKVIHDQKTADAQQKQDAYEAQRKSRHNQFVAESYQASGERPLQFSTEHDLFAVLGKALRELF